MKSTCRDHLLVAVEFILPLGAISTGRGLELIENQACGIASAI